MAIESAVPPPAEGADPSRRDFLVLATGALAATGTAFALWPFIDALNPAADQTALLSIEVDLSPIAVGQRVTVSWRSKPVFIVRRTPEEIAAAQADDGTDLIDPQPDAERVQQAEWLIVVGICTHLGCIPLGQRAAEPVGNWGGWFCACHGSQYDTSGRVRRGPAPRNLDLPPYAFTAPDVIQIG